MLLLTNALKASDGCVYHVAICIQMLHVGIKVSISIEGEGVDRYASVLYNGIIIFNFIIDTLEF